VVAKIKTGTKPQDVVALKKNEAVNEAINELFWTCFLAIPQMI